MKGAWKNNTCLFVVMRWSDMLLEFGFHIMLLQALRHFLIVVVVGTHL